MKSTLVEIEPRKHIIARSDWPKKELADYHLEALLFCEFACKYCSSNAGLHLKFLKRTIQNAVRAATGEDFDPHNAGHVVIAYHCIVEALEQELDGKRRPPGAGKTLVYSQLTDGFSPVLEKTGTARRILELLIEKTEYRIRVLTKSATVKKPEWVRFFAGHSDRFVVGLSVGTLDAAFARRMEWRTSSPASRIQALQTLQDAGVPTFGMLCPVFPQVLDTDELERLMDAIRPEQCEHVWAEPYNDRNNWEYVRACYPEGSAMWDWMTRVFEQGDKALWSRYATDLYTRLHTKALSEGWTGKLRYLLYEGDIPAEDAPAFAGLDGVLLQSTPGLDGRSENAPMAALQQGGSRPGVDVRRAFQPHVHAPGLSGQTRGVLRLPIRSKTSDGFFLESLGSMGTGMGQLIALAQVQFLPPQLWNKRKGKPNGDGSGIFRRAINRIQLPLSIKRAKMS